MIYFYFTLYLTHGECNLSVHFYTLFQICIPDHSVLPELKNIITMSPQKLLRQLCYRYQQQSHQPLTVIIIHSLIFDDRDVHVFKVNRHWCNSGRFDFDNMFDFTGENPVHKRITRWSNKHSHMFIDHMEHTNTQSFTIRILQTTELRRSHIVQWPIHREKTTNTRVDRCVELMTQMWSTLMLNRHFPTTQ